MLKRLLGISVILVLLAACGSDSNTEQPDIEAMVQARLSIISTPTPHIITKEIIKEVEVPV